MTKPSDDLFFILDRAFHHFNTDLFNGELPAVLFHLKNQSNSSSSYTKDRWHDGEWLNIVDEIVMNPECFRDQSGQYVLATLVHEMCHLSQHHFGRPSRPGYHNREWADLMELVGLMPSKTDKPGGKRTGQGVGQYVLSGGRFEHSCQQLLNTGFIIPYFPKVRDQVTAKKKCVSKTKFTCPGCGINIWGKPTTQITCGKCNKAFIAAKILKQYSDYNS